MAFFRAALRLPLIAIVLLSLLCTLLLPWDLLLRGDTIRLLRFQATLRRAHLRLIARIAGLSVVMDGSIDQAESPYLLLANHISYWDVIAIGSLFPVGFIAKLELRAWPMLGMLAARAQTLFVRRECGRDRLRVLYKLRQRARRQSYCVFPEGTTRADTLPTRQHWYRGQVALLANPALPIYILGLHYREQQAIAWIDDDGLLPHLLRCLGRQKIELFICLEAMPHRHGDPRSLNAWSDWALAAMRERASRARELSADILTLPPWLP